MSRYTREIHTRPADPEGAGRARIQRETLRAAVNALVAAAEWHMAEHTLYECRKDERSNRWRDLQRSFITAAKREKQKARRRLSALLRQIEGTR